MLDADLRSVGVLWVGLSRSLDGSSWGLLHGCAAVERLADTMHALDREMVVLGGPPAPRE